MTNKRLKEFDNSLISKMMVFSDKLKFIDSIYNENA